LPITVLKVEGRPASTALEASEPCMVH
jgi:hypothetical protein